MAKHGQWFWHELTTGDPEGARAFYGALLGWTSRSMDMGPMGTYTIWKRRGKDHGGMMAVKGGKSPPPMWMTYVQVDDVDASAKLVKKLGGTVIVKPTDIPGVGRFSVITDPAGAVLSLMTPEA